MPLPRPIGDPFAAKDEDQSTSTPARRPITSSAFSFHLGPKSNDGGRKPASSGLGKKDEVKVEKNDWTPIRSKVMPTFNRATATATPLREMTPMKPLDSLPSFSLRTPTITDRKKLNDSPFAHPTTKRKLDEKTMLPMNLAGVDLGEGIYIENVKRRVEEEGIGVSPRGKKIIKYHGRGPVPLSFILSNALNSQHSSLVLFYASLQNTLYPTRTPKKGRMTPSALTEGLYPKAPTIVQHIKTAPVLLKPVGVVKGRTGGSTMVYCEVIKGNLDQVGLGKEQRIDENGKVLVVFQPVPAECAKLGLDPRILSLKPSGTYEIGLWGPWSTTATPEDQDKSGRQDEGDGEGEVHGDGIKEKEEKQNIVVFASRYLIAES